MKKKPMVCDCDRPAYRLKHGEPICRRCDEMEHEQAKASFPVRIKRYESHKKDVEYNLALYEP